jgi:glyoxylase-like metal-dependent hydrolase (beta-lactamase superfamily II)
MNATAYICTTCGVQYEPSEVAPQNCPICEDERQYVNPSGQSWTTLLKINQQHKNIIELVAPDLYAIYTSPAFGIGQRAHLILSPGGNILWDCITNIDDSTVDLIQKLGGISAIAISHPHYFSTIAEWSHRFGNIPVYVHTLDAQWLGRKDPMIRLWEGMELTLHDGIKLVCCGGHFPGASVLYWPSKKGSLLVGDTIQVSPDLKTVSFMYSYPNLIPLPEREIRAIEASVKELRYDAMYGAFGRYIYTGAKQAMDFSVKRYLKIFGSE